MESRDSTGKSAINVSSLAAYTYCPRKLYLEGANGRQLQKGLPDRRRQGYFLSSRSLRLRGMMDSVASDKDGVVAVHTAQGKAPRDGVWPGHRLQMGAYLLLLEEAHGEKQLHGVVRYAPGEKGRQPVERPVVMNPFLRYEVLDARDRIFAMLAADSPPAAEPSQKKCSACQVRERCLCSGIQ